MVKKFEEIPRLRIMMGAVVSLGPGKADLLEAINRAGSISAAARDMGMSYRRAWNLIEAMNGDFRLPLVEKSSGGVGGGGAVVTTAGFEALERYRSIEKKAAKAVRNEIAAFSSLLKRNPDSN